MFTWLSVCLRKLFWHLEERSGKAGGLGSAALCPEAIRVDAVPWGWVCRCRGEPDGGGGGEGHCCGGKQGNLHSVVSFFYINLFFY